MSRYKASPHHRHDLAPSATLADDNYTRKFVRALWEQDNARADQQVREAQMPQAPIATTRVK